MTVSVHRANKNEYDDNANYNSVAALLSRLNGGKCISALWRCGPGLRLRRDGCVVGGGARCGGAPSSRVSADENTT